MMLVLVLVTAVLFGKSSAQSCSSNETEEILVNYACIFDDDGEHVCSIFPGRFLSWEVLSSDPETAGCAANSTGVTVVEFPAVCLLSLRFCVPVTADLCGADEIMATSHTACQAVTAGTGSCPASPSDFPGTIVMVVQFRSGPVSTCEISPTLQLTASVPGSCFGRILSCVATTTQAPSCNAGEMPVLTGVTCIRRNGTSANPCDTTLADIPGRLVAVGVTSVVPLDGQARGQCNIDEMLVATIDGGPSVCSGFAVSCVDASPPPVCEESEESSDSSDASDSDSSEQSKQSGRRNGKRRLNKKRPKNGKIRGKI